MTQNPNNPSAKDLNEEAYHRMIKQNERINYYMAEGDDFFDALDKARRT